MILLKKYIKDIANKFGIQISSYSLYTDEFLQLVKSLNYFEIDLVLDVGANEGQFANLLRKYNYKKKIVSFEPSLSAYNKLINYSNNDHKWTIYPRCAIGSNEIEQRINISNNSVSSSLLDIKNSKHSDEEIKFLYDEVVNEKKLDSIIPNFLIDYKNIFLKIDVQGYEDRVIDGCIKNMNHIKGILVETSTEEIYSGQKLWDEIIYKLLDRGYELWFVSKGIINKKNGRNLQNDFCLFRK